MSKQKFLVDGDLSEWKVYCKEARKAGYVPLVVSTSEGGKVFTFSAPGCEEETTAKVRKDFSKGGLYEARCEEGVFLMR